MLQKLGHSFAMPIWRRALFGNPANGVGVAESPISPELSIRNSLYKQVICAPSLHLVAEHGTGYRCILIGYTWDLLDGVLGKSWVKSHRILS